MLFRLLTGLFALAVCNGNAVVAGAYDEVSDALRKKNDAVKTLDRFYQRRMDELELDFLANAKLIRQEISKTLEALKSKAAQTVDLDTANKVNDRLIEIQSTKLEPPKLSEATNSEPETDPDFSGTWIGKWGTNNRSLRLVIAKDNKIKIIDSRGEIQELQISKAGQRFLVVKTDHHDLELIRQDDRMVVLGWSKSKDRHIMVDPPNLMAVLVPGS